MSPSRSELSGMLSTTVRNAQTSAANLVLSAMLPVLQLLAVSVALQLDELSSTTSRLGLATPPEPDVKMSMSSAMTREEPPRTRAAAKEAARMRRRKGAFILMTSISLGAGGGRVVYTDSYRDALLQGR